MSTEQIATLGYKDPMQLAFRPFTPGQSVSRFDNAALHNQQLYLSLGYRAILPKSRLQDATPWRTKLRQGKIAFRHSYSLQVDIETFNTTTANSTGHNQRVWTGSNDTVLTGIALEDKDPDVLILNNSFFIPIGALSVSELSSSIGLGNTPKNLVIRTTLSCQDEHAVHDVSKLLHYSSANAELRGLTVASHYVITTQTPSGQEELVMPLYIPSRGDSLDHSLLLQLDWRASGLQNNSLPKIYPHQTAFGKGHKKDIKIEFCHIDGTNTETETLDTLKCSFCYFKEFADLHDLFQHLRTVHTSLKFSLDAREVREGSIKAKFSYVLKSGSVRENFQPNERDSSPEPSNIQLRQPGFERLSLAKSRLATLPALVETAKKAEESVASVPAEDGDRHRQSKSKEQSESLEPETSERNKRWAVPKAPEGVTFVRTRTKRPLAEGELVGESDVEVEEPWLLNKHLENVKALPGASEVTRQFLSLFDTSFFKERLHGKIYVPAALKRFAATYAVQLKNKDMMSEFCKKGSLLIMDGVITMDDLWDCIDIIEHMSVQNQGDIVQKNSDPSETNASARAAPPAFANDECSSLIAPRIPEAAISQIKAPPSRDGALVISSEQVQSKASDSTHVDDQSTFDTSNAGASGGLSEKHTHSPEIGLPLSNHQKDRPWALTCICGKYAWQWEDRIFCSREKCVSDGYHMSCCSVEDFEEFWVCPICRLSGSVS